MNRSIHARILIVDDDETELFLLRYALEGAGFSVAEANSAESGLEICDLRLPDALVLDATLPGLDGLDMCRALRRNPHSQNLPILVLTGRQDPESECRALEAGATDFMTKTSDWPSIVNRIRKLIDRIQHYP